MTATDRLRVAVIIGSTREGRFAPTVADWFVARAAEARPDLAIDVIDLAEADLPLTMTAFGQPRPEPVATLAPRLAEADAFVIVTPEYNQGYPAPLKNALDYLYAEWLDKPVGFVSYGMTSGGMRAVQQLKPVVSALGMVPVNAAVVVHLRQTVDEHGTFTPGPGIHDAAHGTLDELLRLASALRTLREPADTAAALG